MKVKKRPLLKAGVFIMAFSILLAGCSSGTGIGSEGQPVEKPTEVVEKYTGEKSLELPFVYTAKKELSLTFNGMGDKDSMAKLLKQLDKYKVKATFFLPGIRVAEEPDIAAAILAGGHEIENNTLNQLDLNKLDYEQIYKEVKLANDVIEENTGSRPKYVRTRSGDYPEDLPLVAAQLGLKAVVSYNINPKDRDMQSAKEIGDYVKRYIHRGGIISLNTDINPEVIASIPYIAAAADEIGYKLVTLDELVSRGGVRKPAEQVPGYDAARINSDYKTAKYRLIYQVDTPKKHIALTFDDWGSDKTVTKILDILAEKGVHATFFLRAKGVETNPNLARAMVEEGHDVANHSYSHPVVTSLTADELQKDIVKAHQVITDAIQEQPVMLFRPPTGVVNDERAKAIAAVGYPDIAMYDVTMLDWDASNSADDIVKGALAQTKPGSVILLHMLDDIHTIEALPRVIDSLEGKGYTFVKMADLIKEQKN
ncbi:polysaccharide deacetylase family protein [Paenibacillus faecis]|uniref:Polysaccharide deacetylase family protein n=1 Tax=Paenibacillus faecis TaxID=862114 RepID=A0A5D0CWV3_9BACL|nr:polysaccharide deacetylase family protein [Paenibacillus faecis]TYA14436.1 polysaccharide deacetylase family protein [Paenibacillus faecis]